MSDLPLINAPPPRTVLMERALRALGAVSLFWKVLLANGFLVLSSVLVGMMLSRSVAMEGRPLDSNGLIGFAAGVTALSLIVNAIVLRAAFLPLVRLERTANAVRHGEYSRRAPDSYLSDPTIRQLTDAFNAMLSAQEESRAALTALSSRTLDAQEDERRRIARELHDETAQELTALLVQIRLAAAAAPEETREGFAELRAATARILDGVRRLARELRPTILDDLGLVEAVRAFAQETATRTKISITVRETNFGGRLDPTQSASPSSAGGTWPGRRSATMGGGSISAVSPPRRPTGKGWGCWGCASAWCWSAASWTSTRDREEARSSARASP